MYTKYFKLSENPFRNIECWLSSDEGFQGILKTPLPTGKGIDVSEPTESVADSVLRGMRESLPTDWIGKITIKVWKNKRTYTEVCKTYS